MPLKINWSIIILGAVTALTIICLFIAAHNMMMEQYLHGYIDALAAGAC
jgi:hypothetical protein